MIFSPHLEVFVFLDHAVEPATDVLTERRYRRHDLRQVMKERCQNKL